MKAPSPSNMDVLSSIPILKDLGEWQRKVLLAVVVFFFFMFSGITALLAYYIYEPEITAFLGNSTPRQVLTQVSQVEKAVPISLPTKTPACSGAFLMLGSTSLPFETVQIASDGTVNLPTDRPVTAYWINNLVNNDVFVLSTTQENLDLLTSLQAGVQATITWDSCNTVSYILLSAAAGVPAPQVMLDQVPSGLVVYIPESPLGTGMTVQGRLESETITIPPTSAPSSNAVNAEISLLETTTSGDLQTIQVQISIFNFGAEAIALDKSDVTLTSEGIDTLALMNSSPKLPQKIKPGETKTFSLVFPRPDTPSATLKIYTVEYDLEDY